MNVCYFTLVQGAQWCKIVRFFEKVKIFYCKPWTCILWSHRTSLFSYRMSLIFMKVPVLRLSQYRCWSQYIKWVKSGHRIQHLFIDSLDSLSSRLNEDTVLSENGALSVTLYSTSRLNEVYIILTWAASQSLTTCNVWPLWPIQVIQVLPYIVLTLIIINILGFPVSHLAEHDARNEFPRYYLQVMKRIKTLYANLQIKYNVLQML